MRSYVGSSFRDNKARSFFFCLWLCIFELISDALRYTLHVAYNKPWPTIGCGQNQSAKCLVHYTTYVYNRDESLSASSQDRFFFFFWALTQFSQTIQEQRGTSKRTKGEKIIEPSIRTSVTITGPYILWGGETSNSFFPSFFILFRRFPDWRRSGSQGSILVVYSPKSLCDHGSMPISWLDESLSETLLCCGTGTCICFIIISSTCVVSCDPPTPLPFLRDRFVGKW